MRRGRSLIDAGKLGEAAALYQKILDQEPGHVEALSQLGLVHMRQKNHAEALEAFDASLSIDAAQPVVFNNRGIVLKALGRHQEAIDSYDRALALNPAYARAHFNRGNAVSALGRYEEAIADYDKALALDPNYANATNNRGDALQSLERHEEALAAFDRAIRLAPKLDHAHHNRGNALRDLCRYEEALASYDKALDISPGYELARMNSSLVLLLLGNFDEGWRRYESRWIYPSTIQERRHAGTPLWLGKEPLDGRTILLHAEQGIGDAVQFCRYAKPVKDLGARVIFEVKTPLLRLMSSLEGVDDLVAFGSDLPPFNYQTPLLSLPLAFGTRLGNVPARVPYLRATPDSSARWSAELGEAKGLRVGLVWSGNPAHKNDKNRSIGLEHLLPLTRSGAAIVGLQKEVRPGDQAVLERNSEIRNIGAGLDDLDDTAAVISQLDLVISVDTAVAHLAGALGKPVWIMLPYAAEWRWLRHREDSPWYPTARLFRQSAPGDWEGVVARIGEALEQFAA